MQRDLKKLMGEYLEAYTTMSLATSTPDGAVNCATVCYAVDSEGNVVFACDRTTTKARHLQLNPRASVTMQDGGRTMRGVQMRGRAEEVSEGPGQALVRNALKKRNPDVAAFYDNDKLAFFTFLSDESYLINFTWGVDWRQLVR